MTLPVSKILSNCSIVFIITFLLVTNITYGQKNQSTTILELSVDNDIAFLIDRYYSSGITLNFYFQHIKKSPITKILLPNRKNDINYYSMSITHRMYTPERTLTPEIQYTDHPYASYLLIGTKKISFSPEKRIKQTSVLEVGVIGSLAGGEAFQNGIHKNIEIAQTSEGWHNQVQNDICIQYSAIIEKGLISQSNLELNGFVGASIGVPHTEAQLGGYIRIGVFNDYFRGIGIDLSPDLHAWIFCSGSIYLVNYNATLQGGTINQNNVHTINPINNTLLHGRFGGVLEYSRLNIEYGMEVRSPEFSTAYWHRWAHVNVAFAF